MNENVIPSTGQEKKRKNEAQGLVAVAPTANIATTGAKGLEGISREDIIIPRIKLLQATSTEVANGTGSPGTWYNTLGHSYEQQVEIIVINRWNSRTLFFGR